MTWLAFWHGDRAGLGSYNLTYIDKKWPSPSILTLEIILFVIIVEIYMILYRKTFFELSNIFCNYCRNFWDFFTKKLDFFTKKLDFLQLS